MKETLKNIYALDYIDNPNTSLLRHYNRVISKTEEELDVDDICMLIRQELFLDLIIPKAIELIKLDHKVGDNYDYCLLNNLSKISCSLATYRTEILELIKILENDYSKTEFEMESDKEDYLESIKRLKNKI